MKSLSLLVLIFLTVLPDQCIAQTDSTEYKKIVSLVQQTQKQFIPDKRTAVFELNPDKAGNLHIETTDPQAESFFRQQLSTQHIRTTVTTEVYPSPTLKDQVYGLVNLSVVNVRTAPRHSAEMATQVLLGTQLDLLKFESGYYLVRTPEGYIAWLDHYAVKPKTRDEINEWKKHNKLIFTADYGHALAEASPHSKRVSDLVMGNILENLGEAKGFYKVGFPDGRTAFIPKAEMTDYSQWLNRKTVTAKEILNIAEKLIGVPYLWGGTSIKGVDCSGLTKTAYFMNGMIIPRDASQQVLSGQPVEILAENKEPDQQKILSNLQAGDLLFFAGSKQTNPDARVTHVAIYIGNGEFIHSAGLVRINSLIPGTSNFDETQYNTLVSARRYLGYAGTEGLSLVSEHKAYRP